MANKIRVLQVIPTLMLGGISSVVMNWYRHIDRNKYHFDFIVFNEGVLREEIESLGGEIFLLPTIKKNPVQYVSKIIELLKNDYNAVHVHNSFKNGVLLFIAKVFGVPTRVCHSHTSGVENKWLLPVFSILKWVTKSSSNIHVACGKEAGEFLYGHGSFLVLNNAISVDPFLLTNDGDDNNITKQKFGLPLNKRIIMHVGRFSIVKNHQFIIKLIEEMDVSAELHFVFIGEGPLKSKLSGYIESHNLSSQITLLPATKDIPSLLKCATGFIMPSLFEGVSVALLEAQAASLPCFVSDTIAFESDMGLNLVEFLPLDDAIKWTEHLNKCEKSLLEADQIKSSFFNRNFTTDAILLKLNEIYNEKVN